MIFFSYICKKQTMEQPPKIQSKQILRASELSTRPDVNALVRKYNDEYLYWTDIKYKLRPEGITAEEIWAVMKMNRMSQQIRLGPDHLFRLTITNRMQYLCHHFDMNFGGSWENTSIIPTADRERYLISSLIEEAISSSQMEGAATTRKVAKEMLLKNNSPKNKSEQMIANNYKGIQFIVEHKADPLSVELILQIHALMTSRTLNRPEDEGRFRDNDDVVVANGITNEIVHVPPTHQSLPLYMDQLCKFLNDDSTDVFIHPVIKAIIAHFMLAWCHPFVDGNGRTARALFYWYMLKNGYWLTEYLSISRVIYASKPSYEKAFLHVEADDNDLGYFVNYHLRVLNLAFKELQNYIQRKVFQKQNSIDFLKLENINERQAMILSMIRNQPKLVLTVKEIENRFAVSHTTAKSDLDGLVSRGLIEKVAINKVKSSYVKGEKFDDLTQDRN